MPLSNPANVEISIYVSISNKHRRKYISSYAVKVFYAVKDFHLCSRYLHFLKKENILLLQQVRKYYTRALHIF